MLKHWTASPRGTRWLAGGTVAIVLALVVAWVLFVPAADWLAHHDVGSAKGPLLETARDAARGRLLTLGAGLLAAGALVFTARNFWLSREGQVTDRYTKAIEQLGSEKLAVRIGGIYALERIARDSARDHPTVMEVLSAFIREYPQETRPPPDPGDQERKRQTRPDVQAAATVIGRRNAERDIRGIDLTGADLSGADLAEAHLASVDLAGADLSGADLSGANLTLGGLSNANLSGADLTDAHLRDADLLRANLAGADLFRADLSGADLRNADLTRAILFDADLNGADMAAADVTRADLNKVRWPGYVPVPDGWKLDAGSGRLQREGTDPGPTQTG